MLNVSQGLDLQGIWLDSRDSKTSQLGEVCLKDEKLEILHWVNLSQICERKILRIIISVYILIQEMYRTDGSVNKIINYLINL